jgi:hypothetical protein
MVIVCGGFFDKPDIAFGMQKTFVATVSVRDSLQHLNKSSRDIAREANIGCVGEDA